MSRILVVGGDGLIGQALRASYHNDGVAVLSTSRKDQAKLPFDLNEPEKFSWDTLECSAAILCTQHGSITECERNPIETWRTNVDAVTSVINRLVERGVFVIYLSTDMVFGDDEATRDERDPVRPDTEYARQKVAVERHLSSVTDQYAIVRLSKVVARHAGIVKQAHSVLDRGERFDAFTNRSVSPVSLNHVTHVIRAIERERASGVFHCGGAERLSYFEFFSRIVDDPSRLTPTLSPDGPRRVALLRSARALDLFSLSAPTLDQILRDEKLKACQ